MREVSFCLHTNTNGRNDNFHPFQNDDYLKLERGECKLQSDQILKNMLHRLY